MDDPCLWRVAQSQNRRPDVQMTAEPGRWLGPVSEGRAVFRGVEDGSDDQGWSERFSRDAAAVGRCADTVCDVVLGSENIVEDVEAGWRCGMW